MSWFDFLVASSGPGPTLLAAVLACGFTVLILRWPAAVAYLSDRLTERSTQGSLIFAANTVQALITGAIPWSAAVLLLLQCAYHILLPASLDSAVQPLPAAVPVPATPQAATIMAPPASPAQ